MVLAPDEGLPPALLLSLGIHLVLIFGFLLSSAGDSATEAAIRAVTVLLVPTAEAQEIAQAEASANQRSYLYKKLPEASLDQSALPTTIEPVTASVTQSVLTMSAAAGNTPPHAPVAARTSLDTDYLLQWQDEIERFGPAHHRSLNLRQGDGDMRLKVSLKSDSSVQQIDLLQSSGSAELDRAAVDTGEKLAPFAPFPKSLARETEQRDINRTWQFRR